MRARSVVLAAAIGALGPLPARAQTNLPHMVVTIGAGAFSGGDLWRLPSQLENAPNNQYDTLSLGRRRNAGIDIPVGVTYFPGERLGYTLELGWFGTSTVGECTPRGPWALDSQARNQLACAAVDGGSVPTSVFAVQGGFTWRITGWRYLNPYARATAGIGFLSNYFVETSAAIYTGSCGLCTYTLLEEPGRPFATWVATLAVGNTVFTQPAYSVRLELRDNIMSLPVATDSTMPNAGSPPFAKTGWSVRHALGLSIALDVNLERTHRRRY